MIIIETPAPPTRERLVLVRVDDLTQSVDLASVRDPTPEDLEREGWVRPSKVERARLDAAERANRAQTRAVRSELEANEARKDLDAMRARAEKAEAELAALRAPVGIRALYRRLVDHERARESAPVDAPVEGEPRIAPGSPDHVEAWDAIAAFAAAGGGTSTSVAVQRTVVRIEDVFRKFVAFGAAWERARHAQPSWPEAKGRATDEDLFLAYDGAYVTACGGTCPPALHRVTDSERAGILAVAARVRQEDLVARAVAAGASASVIRDGDTWRVLRTVEDAAGYVSQRGESGIAPADVPATLARLLDEAAR